MVLCVQFLDIPSGIVGVLSKCLLPSNSGFSTLDAYYFYPAAAAECGSRLSSMIFFFLTHHFFSDSWNIAIEEIERELKGGAEQDCSLPRASV